MPVPQMNKSGPYAIVIPTYNRLEFTKQCFNALLKYTNFDLVQKIIVFDNFSKDGSVEYIKNFGFPAIQGSFTNANFCLNIFTDLYRNLSIKYLIKLDNDRVVKPDWLDTCHNFLQHHPKTGTLFFCKRVGPHIPEQSNVHGGNFIAPFHLIKKFGLFSTSGKYPGCQIYHAFVHSQGYARYSIPNIATDISWSKENIYLVKYYVEKNWMRSH